jgi:putative nucleotidyltransferase with HDIG domain
MPTNTSGLNVDLFGTLALSQAQEFTKGSIFMLGLLCTALVVLIAYMVRARLVRRRCYSEQRLLEMSTVLGVYDPTTALHSRRVTQLAEALLEELEIPLVDRRTALVAAQVHDIGKTAISEAVLLKPGSLTGEEWKIMRAHAELGAELLARHGFCSEVVRIVRHHHERWDGGGYPAGLAGRQIPIGARVLAVVDGFDAMTSDRPYRAALRLNEAVYRLHDGSGTQFDPEVVEAFLRLGMPSVYMEATPPHNASTTSGRAGRSLGAEARSLAGSAEYVTPMAG